MRVIIAGSRSITDIRYVRKAMKILAEQEGIVPTEVVCGMARGLDRLGKKWAEERGIPVKEFRAAWEDLSAMNARILTNKWGRQYNANAGHDRNAEMAWYAAEEGTENGCLVAIWDGYSPGTRNMIEQATKAGIRVFEFIPKQKDE